MSNKCDRECFFSIGCPNHREYESETANTSSKERINFSSKAAAHICQGALLNETLRKIIIDNLALQMSISNETLKRNIIKYQEQNGYSKRFSRQSSS